MHSPRTRVCRLKTATACGYLLTVSWNAPKREIRNLNDANRKNGQLVLPAKNAYFDADASCRTDAINVLVARVSVRSRRYAMASSLQSSFSLGGMRRTRPASTWSRAKLVLIRETPSPAATKLLIMPTLGSSIGTCNWDL